MGGACPRPDKKGTYKNVSTGTRKKRFTTKLSTECGKLEQLTNDLVMNSKYVPKKYRYVWTQEAFRLSMAIFENARRANILYPRDEETLKRRLFYLQTAETDSEALLTQIAFARNNFSIPAGSLKEWEKLCIDTKNSIRRRRKDDFERFEKELRKK